MDSTCGERYIDVERGIVCVCDCQIYKFSLHLILSCLQFPLHLNTMLPDVQAAEAAGGGMGSVLDGKELQRFEKSFVEVESILDQNRVLINEIHQNHESKVADNLGRNVGLIRELNNNIRKVVHLYSHLISSTNLQTRHKRTRPTA